MVRKIKFTYASNQEVAESKSFTIVVIRRIARGPGDHSKREGAEIFHPG